MVDTASPAHELIVTKTVTITATQDQSCLKKAAFALIEITTQGCLASVGTATALRFESSDAVKVNGIPFPAPPSGKKFLATGPTTADPGGRIGIASAAIKLGSFTVFSGVIDWALPAGGKGDEKTLKTLTVPASQKLFGLKVGGSVEVKIGFRADGVHYATFPLNIQLPDVFKTGPDKSAGGASGIGAVRVDDAGVHYDGLRLQVSNVYVGKLKVLSACFSFVPSGASQAVATCPIPSLGGSPFLQCNDDVNTDRWDGNAIMELPTASKAKLALFGGVANERLSKLGGFVDNLGTSVPIVSGVYLNRVGVGLCVYPPPFKLKGTVGVNILPVGGKSTISVNGYFLYTDEFAGNPWSLELGGDVNVLDRKLGSGSVIIRPTGSIDFSVQAKFSLFGVVSIDGKVVGWLEIPNKTFNIDGSVRACIAVCANADAVLSSTGIAGCLDLGTITYYVLVRNSNWHWYAAWRVHWESRHISLRAGFGHRWSQSKVDLFGGSCNLGNYRATRTRAAQTGTGRVFQVASGTQALALNVIGRNGPPKVKLTGPGSVVISSPTDATTAQQTGSYVLAENPTESSTSIVLIKPAAGSWTVEALDGGDSIVGLESADFQAPAEVEGTVVHGPKGKLALGMSYALPAGATMAIVERGPKVEHTLAAKVAGKSCPGPNRPGGQKLLCFTKTFTPSFGPAGTREILAVVSRDGVPLSTTRVATFKAPKPATPTKPARLRLERRSSTVVVAFDRSLNASSHTLSFSLSTGKMFGVQPSKLSCRTVLITGVPKGVAVSVRVAGVRRDLEVGRYATATLVKNKSRAGNRAKLPKRTCATASGA